MAHKPDTTPPNPLKSQGESKRTVKETTDRAVAGPARNVAAGGADEQRRSESPEHADQGATSRDAHVGPWSRRRQEEAVDDTPSPGASNAHPGQHGGVRAADDQPDPRTERGSGVKHGSSPADEESSERTGTAPDRGASSRRSGKTGADRHRPRTA